MSMHAVDYLALTAADAEQLAAVQIAAWPDGYAGMLPSQIMLPLEPKRRTPDLQVALSAPNVLAAGFLPHDQNRILAFCQGGSSVFFDRTRSTEFFHLAVDPDVQDHGIGTALFLRMADRLRDLGGRVLVIKAWAQNQRAMLVFTKLGAEIDHHAALNPGAWPASTWHYIWHDIELLFERLEVLLGERDRAVCNPL